MIMGRLRGHLAYTSEELLALHLRKPFSSIWSDDDGFAKR